MYGNSFRSISIGPKVYNAKKKMFKEIFKQIFLYFLTVKVILVDIEDF